MSAQNVPAPAKINLFLAVTGRRPDGFHDLVSVAAPLLWGDMVEVEPGGPSFTVTCDNRDVPTIQMIVLVLAGFYVFVNIVTDVVALLGGLSLARGKDGSR